MKIELTKVEIMKLKTLCECELEIGYYYDRYSHKILKNVLDKLEKLK